MGVDRANRPSTPAGQPVGQAAEKEHDSVWPESDGPPLATLNRLSGRQRSHGIVLRSVPKKRSRSAEMGDPKRATRSDPHPDRTHLSPIEYESIITPTAALAA